VKRGQHVAKRSRARPVAERATSRDKRASTAPSGPSRHMAREQSFEERLWTGINGPVDIASATAITEVIPVVSLAPTTRPRALTLIKEPELRGALALMLSAGVSGGLALAFWSLTAHRHDAYVVGSVTAEVASITFLASVGSLNLVNVFARFLPQAGWYSRRLILTSYGGAALTGLLAAVIFLLTPMGTRLVLGGGPGRLAFAICVVLNSVFMIQDGGLVGFGRFGWVPIENVLVASARLALLPVAATFFSARIGVLWSWALPMVVAVLVVNTLIIGRLAGQQANQQPNLPPFGELGRFVAIESVTTAIAASLAAFLPALVTLRLGTSEGGYFYVPWTIAMMVSLLLSSTLISMVREAVASPEKADSTIRRSLGLALVVVIGAMAACLLLPALVLAPLGSGFAAHGAPLLRWLGLSLPAMAVNLLYWATCLIRRRPWPVFALNLTTTGVIISGVLLLGQGTVSRVGIIYCLTQWVIAAAVSLPTIRALRGIRQPKRESQ
jgi:hypothetical protein